MRRRTMIPMKYKMADAEALAWEMAYRLDDEWEAHVSKLGSRYKDVAAGQRRVAAKSWERDWKGVRTRWTSAAASCLNGLYCSIRWGRS